MATTIVTKYGGDAPAASDLVRGELAVDTENGRLYTENSSGAVVEIGLNPEGNVDVTGTVTADGLTVETGVDPASITLRQTGNTNGLILKNFNGNEAQLVNVDNGPFVFKTNDAEVMRLSGTNLGIGTAAPEVTAHVSNAVAAGSDNLALRIQNPTNAADARVGIGFHVNAVTGAGWDGAYIQSANTGSDSGDLRFGSVTNNTLTEVMRISSGNVGIGTASFSQPLTVQANSGTAAIAINGRAADGISSLSFYANDGTTSQGYLQGRSDSLRVWAASGDFLSLASNGSEAARFDTSGNLLVGQTTASSNTVGTSLRSDGRNFYCADGNYSAHFNRKSSDGAIVHFAKDDTITGSIGTAGGDLTVGTGNAALRFNDGAPAIYTVNASTSAVVDGSIDLGAPTARFKDLYLSGGAYLGGTAAANKLDDYEEGTWTPTITGSTTAGAFTYAVQQGKYTKVGNSVALHCAIAVSATSTSPVGDMTITGLPFAVSSQFPSFAVGWSQFITFADQLGAYGGGSIITLRNMLSGGSGGLVQGSAFGSTFYLFISGSYHV